MKIGWKNSLVCGTTLLLAIIVFFALFAWPCHGPHRGELISAKRASINEIYHSVGLASVPQDTRLVGGSYQMENDKSLLSMLEMSSKSFRSWVNSSGGISSKSGERLHNKIGYYSLSPNKKDEALIICQDNKNLIVVVVVRNVNEDPQDLLERILGGTSD